MGRRTAWGLLVTAAMAVLTGCQTIDEPVQASPPPSALVHYLEIVCSDVAAQCASLERVQGLSFGPAQPDLGGARVAEAPDGSLIGVRAPMAEHEQPIIRTYLEVDDIASAVQDAEAAGAVIAYGPVQQGETGTWAIYVLGDVQLGLWQRQATTSVQQAPQPK